MTHWKALITVFVIGCAIWFGPRPEGLNENAWHLLAIFVATISGLVLKPLPMGAVALIGLTITGLTDVLAPLATKTHGTVELLFSGFANSQIWLIVLACFIARGFIKTGLANRIAYMFLYVFGRNALGLSYGLILSDLITAPVIPSSTARAGGVLMPILRSVCAALGSRAEDGTSRKIATFLTLTTFHGTVVSSAMFLTAMAANPIVARLALDSGVEITWGIWAKAAILPGLITLAIIPLVVWILSPPTMRDVSHAQTHASDSLAAMGSMHKNEWIMFGCFLLLLVLWIFGQALSVNPTVAALVGVSILLLTHVLTWRDIIAEEIAWDTLVWFSVLVMMASGLNGLGFIHWFGANVVTWVQHYPWHIALAVLGGIYFYSHYFFASITAHVTSMYAPFMAVSIAVGAPPMLAALSLGFLSALFGGLTHYSSGQAPIMFSSKYVDLKKWWGVGALLGVVYIAIWMGLGPYWWSWLGLY